MVMVMVFLLDLKASVLARLLLPATHIRGGITMTNVKEIFVFS